MRSLMKVGGKEIRVTGQLVRIGRLEADGYQFLEDAQTMLEELRMCGRRIDLFTFTQRLPETSVKYAYPIEWDNVAALPLTTFDHWWKQQIESRVRVKVRKAEKTGVLVREAPFDDAFVQGMWDVYNETQVRQGRPNVHYGKDVETVRREAATFLEHSVFIGAYLEDKMIGFMKLVADETWSQANVMSIVAMTRHRDKSATNALIAQAVRSCIDRGVRNLLYGRLMYGKKKKDGLSDFKETNGFQGIDTPRYYVPLTAAGRLALRLSLHHKLADHLPESVAEKLRELRSSWYNRKVQSATAAR